METRKHKEAITLHRDPQPSRWNQSKSKSEVRLSHEPHPVPRPLGFPSPSWRRAGGAPCVLMGGGGQGGALTGLKLLSSFPVRREGLGESFSGRKTASLKPSGYFQGTRPQRKENTGPSADLPRVATDRWPDSPGVPSLPAAVTDTSVLNVSCVHVHACLQHVHMGLHNVHGM